MGKAAVYPEKEVRDMGRNAQGVRGIKLAKDDVVVGADLVCNEENILTVTELGLGKRTQIREYRKTHRGAKGVINIKITDKNGPVVGIKKIDSDNDIMLMSTQGMAIRLPVKNISVIGRATQGVRLFRLEEGDKVAAVASIAKDESKGENADSPATPP